MTCPHCDPARAEAMRDYRLILWLPRILLAAGMFCLFMTGRDVGLNNVGLKRPPVGIVVGLALGVGLSIGALIGRGVYGEEHGKRLHIIDALEAAVPMIRANPAARKEPPNQEPPNPLVLCLVYGIHHYEGGICSRCGYSDPSQNKGDQA